MDEPTGKFVGWFACSDLNRGSALLDGAVRSFLLGWPATAGLRASLPARGMTSCCVGMSLAEHLDPPETSMGHVCDPEQS